jgi:sporulation-control protein spo0M
LSFFKADIEMGQIPGSNLPCFQEIEFSTRGLYGPSVGEVEVTFVTRPGSTRVILEIDRKARGPLSFLASSHDDIVAFEVHDQDTRHTDWALTIDDLIRSRAGVSRRQSVDHSRTF